MESCFHALTRLRMEASLGRISESTSNAAASISFRQSFHQTRLIRGMYGAGLPTPRTCHVSSLGGKPFCSNDDVIRCPPLCLVLYNYVAMAPLPKICRDTQALLGLKCTVRRGAGNG
jgi:hypothetical protein